MALNYVSNLFMQCDTSLFLSSSLFTYFPSNGAKKKKAPIFSFRKCWSSTNANYLEIKLTKEK